MIARLHPRAMIAGVLAACAVLASCASDPRDGYSTKSSFTEQVDTVFVPVFRNDTFVQGVESDLTDAIVKEIQRTTPWRVTSSRSASTTLSGRVVSARLQKQSAARTTGLAQELAYEVTVEFDWIDNRSGKPIVSRRNFSAAETFIPSRGVGERIEFGQHGAVQELARDIVSELRSPW